MPRAPGTNFWWTWGGKESMKRRYLLKGACCVCLSNGHRNLVPKKAYNAAASACSSSKWRLSTSMMQVDGWTRECLPKQAADGLVSCRKYRSCILLLLVLLCGVFVSGCCTTWHQHVHFLGIWSLVSTWLIRSNWFYLVVQYPATPQFERVVTWRIQRRTLPILTTNQPPTSHPSTTNQPPNIYCTVL